MNMTIEQHQKRLEKLSGNRICVRKCKGSPNISSLFSVSLYPAAIISG